MILREAILHVSPQAQRQTKANPLSWIYFTLAEFRIKTFCLSMLNLLAHRTGFTFVHMAVRSLRSTTQPLKIRCLGLLTFTRLWTTFQIFLLKIFHSAYLAHMAVRSLRSTPQPLKIRSWIIDVHKVVDYISNFFTKNFPFRLPCSHGCSLTSFSQPRSKSAKKNGLILMIKPLE